MLSSNFAADLTVDVAVGAGTTALSAALSSAAAGAVAGSVVPGLGTAVGAVVGLGAGLLSTYLINGTEPGRRAKKWVSEKLSQGYSKVADGAKGLFNGAKKIIWFWLIGRRVVPIRGQLFIPKRLVANRIHKISSINAFATEERGL